MHQHDVPAGVFTLVSVFNANGLREETWTRITVDGLPEKEVRMYTYLGITRGPLLRTLRTSVIENDHLDPTICGECGAVRRPHICI